jgi:hypothetical protein
MNEAIFGSRKSYAHSSYGRKIHVFGCLSGFHHLETQAKRCKMSNSSQRSQAISIRHFLCAGEKKIK